VRSGRDRDIGLRLPVPPLLVISDRHQARQPLEQVAEAVFAGGCRWFSLREKELPPDERRALLAALVMMGRRFAAVVTAHEDIEAVLAVHADGVHLSSGGSPGAALLQAGADYVTVSPVFLTASKPGYGPALGLDGLAHIAAGAPGPVIALGGITPANAGLCLSAGARGIAVMGEIMRAVDPQAIVESTLRAMSG